MSLNSLTQPVLWQRYSKKLSAKIAHLHNGGSFSLEDASSRSMHLSVGESRHDIYFIRFYWLVDTEDGIIVDSKYHLFGPSALIGAAEIACELLVGKNYDEAQKITADQIDQQVRDRKEIPAFPEETFYILNLVLCAIDEASEACHGIPLAPSYVPVPYFESQDEMIEETIKDWDSLSKEQKLLLIEKVITQEIRPTLELDAGGIDVIDLSQDSELRIAYSGACATCFSATGSTLFYIQNILQRKLHPSITVIPEF